MSNYQKAVFLDRDGVINNGNEYYTYTIEKFIINKGVAEGLQLLQEAGFLLIVITNQSGIAKGLYTIDDVEKVHAYMKELLREKGIEITDIYYCPHHPDVSTCRCRKPGTEMLERAIKKYNITTEQSYLIGDSISDIQAAVAMGINAIKIEKNESIVSYCKKIINNVTV
ncbi:MAG: HAD family hydrolase [Bacteroidales bacterium]